MDGWEGQGWIGPIYNNYNNGVEDWGEETQRKLLPDQGSYIRSRQED